jgi:S-DNA-T family DNA segregation ATPase FtsK/SpoIIIE
VADVLLFLFGWSAWWLVPVTCAPGCRAGARNCAARRPPAPLPPRWMFWLGLALLLAASCALEWTRLYRWEPALPGHAGGVLGYTLGPPRCAGWALPGRA